ncbi:MAG: branched-chain amino acid ABC transporter permease [Holophaga sp.]|jgi:ABC-type branched-subunit amino acid transport system permease subunit
MRLPFPSSRQGRAWLLLLALAAALPVLPMPSYVFRLGALIFIYGSVVSSFNLLAGYCGVISVAHAGFFGIGAYTAGLMSVHLHTGFLTGMVAAALLTALLSLVVGFATVRLRGRYLIMATLGINEVINLVMFNSEFTGGPNGLPGVSFPELFGFTFSSTASLYYLNLGGLVLVTAIVALVVNSPFGRAMVALREDERAAEAIGIDTLRTKLMAFTLAGALAGLAGVFYAHNNQFVSYQTFTTDESFILLAMLVIGGLGTVAGPIIGVVLLLALPEALRGAALYRYFLYGLALAVVAPVWPAGLAGIRFRRKAKSKPALGRREGEAA